MAIEVLVPTYGEDPEDLVPAPRLETMVGSTVAIISNGKQGTVPFFDALSRELVERYGVGEVVRVTKPNYSAPAGSEIFDRSKRWHAVVAGVGD